MDLRVVSYRTKIIIYDVHLFLQRDARPRINLTLNNSVADPGSGAFLPLDPGWVKSQDPDPG